MATSTKKKAAAQRPRKAANTAGAARRAPVRRPERAGTQPPAPAIAAPSLAALKLRPLYGLEVHIAREGALATGIADPILSDLGDSYLAAELRYHDALEQPLADVQELLRNGNAPESISILIARFAERFELADRKCGIVSREGRYYFALRMLCEKWDGSWNVLDASKLITAARKANKALGKLIITFLRMLIHHTGVGTWYNGDMEHVEDWLEEGIHNAQEQASYGCDSEYDEEGDYQKDLADLNCIRSGKAAQVAARIRKAALTTPQLLAASISRAVTTHPLKAAMLQACELMKEPHRVGDYGDGVTPGDPDFYDNGIPSVTYDQQNAIMWSMDNTVTAEWEQWLNSIYNESGCYIPMATLVCDPRIKEWDLSMAQTLAWPAKLIEVFISLDNACSAKHNEPRLLIDILT